LLLAVLDSPHWLERCVNAIMTANIGWRIVATLQAGGPRVELDDELADYDSLESSCTAYVWPATHGEP
jgi:hypothetical protein